MFRALTGFHRCKVSMPFSSDEITADLLSAKVEDLMRTFPRTRIRS